MDPFALVLLAIATFTGALVQAATGFGFAIVAAPAFLWVLDSTGAIALLVALHVVQSVFIVPRLWHRAPRWHFRRFLAGATLGCPLGIWALQNVDVRALKFSVGAVILGVIALLVLREWGAALARNPGRKHGGSGAAVATGAVSGLLTALLVMPGPPLMVYFMGQRHAGDVVRALSLSFFAVCYVAVTLVYVALGAIGRHEWITFAWLAPVVLIGTATGLSLTKHFTEASFRVALMVLLLLSGLGAIASAMMA